MDKKTTLRYNGMISLIENSKEKVILDLGAGPNPISSRVPAKKRLIHDVDDSFTKKINVVADLNKERLPLKNESVDIIIAGEIIEHLLDPFKFLKDCFRILKRNGYLIISTQIFVH